ncbi:substrate-binding domain-containing protein [Lactiplantibacillus plantarum]|uniref:substrate-binding domain-containing protein n=1 Tax=Lactiplantibacillus plantarum TaxID=1590 RepID=UPI003F52F2B5
MSNMNDVAKEAGVSRGTVSNYLNNRPIRSDSKASIERAIAKLNYVRNTAARDLRASKSTFVVLIIPTVWTPFFAELTYWIQKDLEAQGYKMILCISNSEFDHEREYVTMAEEQRVAGIITISYSDLTQHVNVEMPLVAIEKEKTGLFPLVTSDNYAGGQLAAEAFRKRDVSQYICLGFGLSAIGAMASRQMGFTDFCNERHLSNKVYDLPSSKFGVEKVKKTMDTVLQEIISDYSDQKIGIFVITDAYAQMVLMLLQDMKIDVPNKIQIIGFDGGKSHKDALPELSSIRQPVELIAQTATANLNQQIHGDVKRHPASRDILPVTFTEGTTTLKIVSK